MTTIEQEVICDLAVKNERTRCAKICDDFYIATNVIKERHLILDIQQRILLPDADKRKEALPVNSVDDSISKLTSPEIQKESKGNVDAAKKAFIVYVDTLYSTRGIVPGELDSIDIFRAGWNARNESDLSEMQARIAQEGGSPV